VHAEESISHFLLQCPHFQALRESLLVQLQRNNPPIEALSLPLLLNGYNDINTQPNCHQVRRTIQLTGDFLSQICSMRQC
jgi:hypothetical protein